MVFHGRTSSPEEQATDLADPSKGQETTVTLGKPLRAAGDRRHIRAQLHHTTP